MNSTANSFHNRLDTNVRAYQAFNPKGWGPIRAPVLTTYTQKVTYQFFPHFHPYVLQLARELTETDSVFDLLAMNVLYQANPDGSLQAIPDSTRAVISFAGGAQLLDANQDPVVTGAPLTLLDSSSPLSISIPGATAFVKVDGSTWSLDGGLTTSLSLPISIPNSITRAIQIKLPAGTPVRPPHSTPST